MDCTKILQHLYIGSCPATSGDIEVLHHDGITAVLNLQTGEDEAFANVDWQRLLPCYSSLGIEVRRVPIRDFDPEDLARKLPQCVQTLRDLLTAGNTIYLHCTAGTGRSPTVAIAYLYSQCGMSIEEAYQHVRSHRPCSLMLDPSAIPQRLNNNGQNPPNSGPTKKL